MEALGPSSKRAKKEEAKESVASGRHAYWAAGEESPVAARCRTRSDSPTILRNLSPCFGRSEDVLYLFLRPASWVGWYFNSRDHDATFVLTKNSMSTPSAQLRLYCDVHSCNHTIVEVGPRV